MGEGIGSLDEPVYTAIFKTGQPRRSYCIADGILLSGV